MPTDLPSAADPAPRALVIDTNVVLDWLVFGHPVGAALDEALASRRWRWIATRAMRDELGHVIVRASLGRWSIDAARVLATWDARANEHAPPTAPGAHERLLCTDPDDQKFIDLAVVHRAGALLSRDRAVLRLAARAGRLGVQIATPERWRAAWGDVPPGGDGPSGR